MGPDNHERVAGAVFILLDNALGEFLVATAVGAIEFAPLPEDPVAVGLRPLTSLRDAVSRLIQ